MTNDERMANYKIPTASILRFGHSSFFRHWSFVIRTLCSICILEVALCSPAAEVQTDVALEALSRLKGIDLDVNPTVKAAVLKTLEQLRGSPQFVEVVRDFNIRDQEVGLIGVAIQNPTNSTGAEAIRLILVGNSAPLRTSLANSNSLELIQALGSTGSKEIVELLEPLLLDNSQATALRKEAIRGLAKVETGASAILKVAKEQKLPDELKLTASSELNRVPWPKIKAEAAQVLPLPQVAAGEPLPSVAELVQRKGDSNRGSEIFRRETVGCNKCHQVRGQGTDFGPDLSEIGSKLGRDALFESILEPSAGIAFGYEPWQLELKNGDEASGLIASETADELLFKSAGGILTRYKKSEIVARTRLKLSIMPTGLQLAMSTQDLIDLVEYISSLKKSEPSGKPNLSASPVLTNLTVAADGTAQFKTVQEAINAAPTGTASNPTVIRIKPGIYKELLYIQREKRFLHLSGEDPTNTVLTYNLNANLPGPDGKPIGTFRTASTFIDADDLSAVNLTFENSAGPIGQALAVRVEGDRIVFQNCRFLGWQDTILDNRGRHYYTNCYIAGHVDFIFGGATSLFEHCHVHCLRDGYITAASTPDNQRFGFVFSHCKISAETPEIRTYLGRPWRAFASVTFLHTEMSAVVRQTGWDNWRDPTREKTARYAEFDSTGPGANPSGRVNWTRQLSASEAASITVQTVLAGSDNWNPAPRK